MQVIKVTFTVLFLILLATACSSHDDGDAALRVKVVGTWATADLALPHQTQMKNGATAMINADGSYISKYQFSRPDDATPHFTSGTWIITNGFFIETVTNTDFGGVPIGSRKTETMKIILLDKHEMILSNDSSPNRKFLRKD